MAIYDFVGIPFPKSEPEFASSKKILGLIKRIEDDVEIRHDLQDVVSAIESLGKLLQNERTLSMTLGYTESQILCEAAVAHAVHLYAKAFNQNKRGLRRLNYPQCFKDAPELVKSAHVFFVKFRNEFFAHSQLRLNEHTLHVLPDIHGKKICPNPSAQVIRTLIARSYEWSNLSAAAQFLEKFLENEIENSCDQLSKNLNEEQITKILALYRDRH